MKSRFLLAAAAVASLSHSSVVRAQAFLSDPRVTNGMGVKAGDFELHPGLAGEFGYDSNYFQRSGNSGGTNPRTGQALQDEPRISAYRLRITPSLSFNTYGRRAGEEGAGPPPSVDFNGRLAASYNALFATDSKYSNDVSKQSNHVAVTAGLGADILPDKPWGADVSADFVRVIEASNDAAVANAFRRDTIRGGVGIDWRPGGGLFKWRLGYGITGNIFEDSTFKTLGNVQHRAETNGQWTFLPRTALVYRGEITWLNFGNGGQAQHNGEMIRSVAGLNGLFTNHWGFLGLIGYGGTFFNDKSANGVTTPAENFDSVIGQAEITFYPTPQPKLPSEGVPVGLSTISVGYNRNFAFSYLGDYYQRDRGYANLTYFLANKFVLTLTGGLSHITRPLVPDPNNANVPLYPGGGENRVDAIAFLEYRPGDSLGINATFRYDSELDHVYVGADDLMFARYQAFLGVRWFL
jgi:hypothetical protein